MAKTISKIATREQRKKLKPSGKPYLEPFERGLDLGYRKGQRGGSWVVRRYLGRERGYAYETIGRADDDPTEVGALAYDAARGIARDRVQALAEEARIATLGPSVAVRDAIEAYLTVRDAREVQYTGGNSKRRNARSRLTRHILKADEALSAKPLAALTADDLTKWREALGSRVGAPERTVHDFKAALNAAARRFQAQLPPEIRDTIRNGLAGARAAPVAREAQVLPDADVRRIIAAASEVDAGGDWDGDLARLVLVLAATGARFSQLVRMTVADVQADQMRLMVPASRKGRGFKFSSHVAVRVGEDVLTALARAIAGRRGSEPLFLRPRWYKGAVGRWTKGERGPWGPVDELNRVWPSIVQRAGLSTATVPYALRHSSIVRGLRAGLPTRLVAALHDSSSAMIEAHYTRFIADALDELAARAIVPLTTTPATVFPLERARG